MSLVYVTGISGSGKSAVLAELRQRGFEGYDSDHDGFCALYDRSKQEFVSGPTEPIWASEWRHTHDYAMVPERAEQLAARARDRLIFLCGMPANEYEFWHLYERVFSLRIDEATLRRRLATRDSNDFGKEQWQLDWVLEVHSRKDTQDLEHGCIAVDATLPLTQVVDFIVRNTRQ